MKKIKLLISILFLAGVFSCKKENVELRKENLLLKSETTTAITSSQKLFSSTTSSLIKNNSGLTYAISPALGVWTSTSSNTSGSCGSSVGGVIKAKVTSVSGDVIWLKIIKENSSAFINSVSVYVKISNVCGELAKLEDQYASYSNSFPAGTTEINIPFIIKPGYKSFYPVVMSGGGRYHANPIQITASGWMNMGETTVQKNILASAKNRIGQFSGQSVISSGMWYTDMSGGDGNRWRTAITDYHNWKLNPGTKTLESIKVTMKSRLTTYTATDQARIVDRIISVYNGTVPSGDNATLAYMGVQKQCMEFVGSTAINNGGTYKPYGSSGVSSSILWRPGMAVYSGSSHAMILSEIQWSNNVPTGKFRVIEANWASTFSNPIGQIPWERKVTTREFTKGSSHYVVSLEK